MSWNLYAVYFDYRKELIGSYNSRTQARSKLDEIKEFMRTQEGVVRLDIIKE